MTETEINEKAREIYTRCFDDVGEYVGVINALVIAVRETSRELEAQIVDFKDYVLKVSKFLHNNYNTRPDKLAYKERDMLLIKELKLFEKWEIKAND